MRLYSRFLILLLSIFIEKYSYSQPLQTKDFYDSIKNYDLSKLWRSDSLSVIEHDYDERGLIFFGATRTAFPEPLGFIGSDYQRFYTHFLSVKKNIKNPYQYIVSGKTRVKNKICRFKGIITISRAKTYVGHYDIKYKQGLVYGEYKFQEDSSKLSSGLITGKMETKFYLDKQNLIFYDDLDLVSDGYSNNKFAGIWKSYKTNVVKKCNWGDFRIPDCGDLDSGVGDVYINEKYWDNDWRNYLEVTLGGNDSIKISKSKVIESVQWWK